MILHGDCLEKLKSMDADSVDSLVTDPPASIGFMQANWDSDKGGRDEWIKWLSSVMKECMRVMKPGAHGLVWAIPRTSHWTATACEDAGFEIRDVVTHLFGSGFPKSHDISKAIDKAAGVEREVVGSMKAKLPTSNGKFASDEWSVEAGKWRDINITAPATPEAKQWQGWGTALKPASEHWILIRKPISEKTVAANVLKHGCGALNIDASRVSVDSNDPNHRSIDNKTTLGTTFGSKEEIKSVSTGCSQLGAQGRFPANLVLSHSPDCVEVGVKKVKPSNGSGKAGKGANGFQTQYVGGEKKAEGFTGGFVNADGTETVAAWECAEGCPVRELDRQSGNLGKSAGGNYKNVGNKVYGKYDSELDRKPCGFGDSGGASRFFKCFDSEAPFLYCAKASKREKNAGCEGLSEKPSGVKNSSGRGYSESDPHKEILNKNFHPCVKPLKLMTYLITMITPRNGTVLDPFAGSGSTGVAAIQSGFKFIGIEREKEYVEIANKRIYHALPEFKKQIL